MSREGVQARRVPANGGGAAGPVTYRIGEAARIVGVSPSALRLWERQGLVRPRRTNAGYRLYGNADLEQLRRVHSMRDEDVSASGIRRLLSVPSSGGDRGQASHALEGRRVRQLRTQRGLSLREASRRSGLSVSFLSAIERDATGVSVATLHRLTEAYGVTLLDLFEGRAVAHRVRPDERPLLELDGSGVRIEQLSLGSVRLEPQLFVLAPGATSEGAYSHAGEEFLFLLEGELTFWIGADERYRLRTGDALTFPSNLPHRWRNRAGGETRLLWINTPPTF